jgi:hypothetical protein
VLLPPFPIILTPTPLYWLAFTAPLFLSRTPQSPRRFLCRRSAPHAAPSSPLCSPTTAPLLWSAAPAQTSQHSQSSRGGGRRGAGQAPLQLGGRVALGPRVERTPPPDARVWALRQATRLLLPAARRLPRSSDGRPCCYQRRTALLTVSRTAPQAAARPLLPASRGGMDSMTNGLERVEFHLTDSSTSKQSL